MINKKKLSLSFMEMKRLRANFGDHVEKLKLPNLLDIQIKSYEKFIQNNITNILNRKDIGLEGMFKNIFPIYSNNNHVKLEYISYTISPCSFSTSECKIKGLTYSAPLKIKVHLDIKNKINLKQNIAKPTIQEIYILDIPLMTNKGTFIINGTERVIISQLHRSPGVFFELDKTKSNTVEKVFYIAKIIPHRGAWLDIEFDPKNCLFARIDKKRKFPLTIILKALDLNIEDILNTFFNKTVICIDNNKYYIKIDINNIKNQILPVDVIYDNKIIIYKNKHINEDHINYIKKYEISKVEITKDHILNKIISSNIINKKNNKILIPANTKITTTTLNIIENNDTTEINILSDDNFNQGIFILNTLNIDTTKTQLDSLIEIYKILKPGELPTKDSAKQLFENLFFSKDKYDLSLVGRMKLNKKINKNFDFEQKTLSKDDIIETIKKLIDIKNGKDDIDDIDHLGNRRVRSVGEITENQFKMGFLRIERSIKEKLSLAEYENLTPQDIINTKPIAVMIREFFCSSQLSQFMDQTNPLSEITHKRRVSTLGPGGLTRERAGFEVRDVHNTYYGKICPIETPEGPNIGLINSLAIYARTNIYGFLETPYIKVNNKKITNTIVYLSAINENEYVIAQANAKINIDNNTLSDDLVSCRYNNEFSLIQPDKVEYIDVSPKQIVSVAAALIPFLEHNDANRALMGSNMQRQAVPILKAEKPLIGTGMERKVATDSGVTLVAKRGGIVDRVDAKRIIIKVNKNEINTEGSNIDIYNLIKFTRSNHNTCINQKPLVTCGDIINKNDILADGPATDLGELALGHNLFTAFMPWNGYNFEDSIIISEQVVKKHKFTSIHIEELICIARDLKLGPEEITSDIPNVSDSSLSNLDESGIISIGAEVNPGDILVGKVTQKGESQLTPEEKLLQAIFGEKASDVKDSSLRVPTGIKGTVTDIQIFTREGVKKDLRTLEIEKNKFNNIKQDLYDELRLLKDDIHTKLKNLYINEKNKNPSTDISLSNLDNYNIKQLLNIKTENIEVNKNKSVIELNYNTLINNYEEKIKIKESKIKQGDELAPGILKIVKISIAIKRNIQPGDKVSGRHGNKGVVSIIVPLEDMPHLDDGSPIDIILNPLGVPSRMNVGQVLETHLGWAAKKLGKKIKLMLQETPIDFRKIKKLLSNIYNMKKYNINFDLFKNNELITLLLNLQKGIPMATPVFNGINEDEIKKLLKIANLPETGKTTLYDGKTGKKFENPITVGYKYMMKLNHLIDDKMHARSTGSYSLVSQQPLGGKAQFGGQRFGEMEVWALEAYGAAYTLQEMLTIKSDDITGRTKIYKNMIDNNYHIETGIPEAFNVLSKEILSLGLNIELENE